MQSINFAKTWIFFLNFVPFSIFFINQKVFPDFFKSIQSINFAKFLAFNFYFMIFHLHMFFQQSNGFPLMFSRVSLALKSQNLSCSIFYFTICSFFYLNFAKSLIFDFHFTTFSPLHIFYQSKSFPSIFSIASKALILQNFLYLIFILKFSHRYMLFYQ